ncbi:conserved hypothetical protein [Hyella patelloides LEGE 07179]|uniref:DUF928 domain-containing protein n=1 Tax=Hyella patelloides LEGE 07179 TaxID=945734 RepID=A0A563VKW3_9CYAN|nr:DUF928 domain-containing protein [Hyella patelloides]VEP12090.1 conserved hypothetical protein [Hyella patelloides LEGE 07179]
MQTLANTDTWLEGYNVSSTPKRTYQRRNTSAGGSRSYCQNPLRGKSLTLLVPEEKVVHQTVSKNPAFFFHSQSTTTIPLIFTLVDPEEIEPLVEKSLSISQPGYHKVVIPQEVKLKPGKIYSWHIAIPCAEAPENFREVLTASVELGFVSPEIAQRIEKTNSPSLKSLLYAREGIWYDAINFWKKAEGSIARSW